MRPFLIFVTALGIYALLTLPALMAPIIYVISLCYAFMYGWIALIVFAAGFYIVVKTISDPVAVMTSLSLLVVASVAIAFHVLGECNKDLNAWHSGGFLLFPLMAVVAGIISLFMAKDKILSIHTSNESQTN